MAIYAVSNEGVTELNSRAQQIENSCQNILQLCDGILHKADENREVMGPHISQLIEIIQEIKQAVTESTDDAATIASILRKVAKDYEDIIAKKLGGGRSK